MAVCKYCKQDFDWGTSDEGWKPLVPIANHDGLDRTYQDENGELRALHHLVCTRKGGPVVKITKLARKVPAAAVAAADPTTVLTSAQDPMPEPRPRKTLGESLAPPGAFSLFRRCKRKAKD